MHPSETPLTSGDQPTHRPCALLTPFYCPPKTERELTSIYTQTEYMVHVRTMQYACEYIKYGTPCWLYLDADRHYPDKPTADVTNAFYQICIGEIHKLFPGVQCLSMDRIPRRTMHGKKMQWKVSYHFVVKVKVMPEQIKAFLEQRGYKDHEPFDHGAYSNGRLLNAPLCCKPKGHRDDDFCPPLNYDTDLNVLDHLVTYVPFDEPLYDLGVVCIAKPRRKQTS